MKRDKLDGKGQVSCDSTCVRGPGDCFTETGSGQVAGPGRGRGGELACHGDSVSVWEDERILEMVAVTECSWWR